MPGLTNVKYHVYKDVAKKHVMTDDTRVDSNDRENFENRIAFTSLLWHPDGGLYCGLTARTGDILVRFDPAKEKFTSLGYQKMAEPFEVKIHRSLCLARDGTIYSATATLYTLDKRLEAPGGCVFRYWPKTGKIEKLCIPVKHDYPQTITLDEKRKLIYGMTQPVFAFFIYHLDTGEVENFDYMGSITHISAIDDDGCFWGTWDARFHYLFKYDPKAKKIVYFNHGLPEGATFADIMYRGAGPVDVMVNGGDGYLYIGTTGGTLCRLDPKTAEVAYLGRPHPTKRMPGLVVLDKRRLLCSGGDEEGGYVAVYDRKTCGFTHLGVLAHADGNKLYRVHDLCVNADQSKAYVAETDVPARSGYLWEAELNF